MVLDMCKRTKTYDGRLTVRHVAFCTHACILQARVHVFVDDLNTQSKAVDAPNRHAQYLASCMVAFDTACFMRYHTILSSTEAIW